MFLFLSHVFHLLPRPKVIHDSWLGNRTSMFLGLESSSVYRNTILLLSKCPLMNIYNYLTSWLL